MQPALAAAVDAHVNNATVGWNTFSTRTVKPDYGNDAKYAIVPRPLVADNSKIPPTIEFYGSPNPVAPGQPTTLHWRAIDASSCYGSWMGTGKVSGEQVTKPIHGVVTYTLDCSGSGGSSKISVQVADRTTRKPAVDLSVSPKTVQAGGIAVLSWRARNSKWCTGSGGWSGSVLMQGHKTVGPLTANTIFTLDCKGPLGDAAKKVSVRVESTAKETAVKDEKGGSGGGGALGAPWAFIVLGVAVMLRRWRLIVLLSD
jgi:hypothetical protein